MPFLPRNFRAYIKTDTDVITADASLSEDHVFKNTVSVIPVEDGSKISDNITIEPNRLEMILLFTDTPTSNFDITEQFLSYEGRGITLFKKVKEIRDKKKIVTVVTGLVPHFNMAIDELSVPRRSGDGRKVECRVVFSEIPIVNRDGTPTQREEVVVAPEINHTAIGLITIGIVTAGPGIGAIISEIF